MRDPAGAGEAAHEANQNGFRHPGGAARQEPRQRTQDREERGVGLLSLPGDGEPAEGRQADDEGLRGDRSRQEQHEEEERPAAIRRRLAGAADKIAQDQDQGQGKPNGQQDVSRGSDGKS